MASAGAFSRLLGCCYERLFSVLLFLLRAAGNTQTSQRASTYDFPPFGEFHRNSGRLRWVPKRVFNMAPWYRPQTDHFSRPCSGRAGRSFVLSASGNARRWRSLRRCRASTTPRQRRTGARIYGLRVLHSAAE